MMCSRQQALALSSGLQMFFRTACGFSAERKYLCVHHQASPAGPVQACSIVRQTFALISRELVCLRRCPKIGVGVIIRC